ncbi:N-acetyltransferase [Myroides sp. M-43]|uniref:N-acetyltransferase n=1 Tax=Myroides oncorhynchi TaxID=2893756 RepID=UPI001E493600|nr:N-acetyltransferase [Myroides oncorhynchi]MCC9043526.1 N-acetyltransferase [Myroides oncorhynchi]
MTQITAYTFTTAKDLTQEQSIDYNNQVDQFNVWPAYVLADKVNLKYWPAIYELFADCQFYLLEGEVVVGNGNCIALHLSETELANLPDRGWDWALEKSVLDYNKGLVPNTLCALQIGLNKEYQGKGISNQLISYMKSIALKMSLDAFILPIRPNLKTNFPLIAMDQYIKWTNKEGLPYDAWVRTHVKGGANIVKVCSESMIVKGTVKEWESWTGLTFQSSGEYLLPVLLNPITIDLANDRGIYIEPNVWMQYDLTL